MKEITESKYAKFFFAGLLLILLCAWFSTGYYQIDEHMQVLEFASWKLGITPATSLPWEFQRQVRATLLPTLVYLVAKFLMYLKLFNPFTTIFLLRLFTGVLSWFVSCKLCLFLLKNMQTEKGKKLFILMAFFLWFVPYLSVRFTAENISGLAFLYGAHCILRAYQQNTSLTKAYILAGALFGISFFIRVTLIIAILGFVTWLLAVKKTGAKNIFILVISAAVIIALNCCLDSWFYGNPVFTLLRYILVFIHHSAPEMGANTPWFLLHEFITNAIFPLSIFLLILFALGTYKNKNDPFIWALIPFVLAHFIIRHKELRFLFPVTFIFIYICSLGFDYVLSNKIYLKFHKYVFLLLLIRVVPVLLYKTLTPAEVYVNYYQYLYNNVSGKNTTLFVLRKNNKDLLWNISGGFYENLHVKPILLDTINALGDSLSARPRDTAYYLDKNPFIFTKKYTGYNVTPVYSYLPLWADNYINKHTRERLPTWTIYRITKAQ